jgi:hypothetical protein
MTLHNHGVGFQISLFQWPTCPNHVIYSENNDVISMHSISYNSKQGLLVFSLLTSSYIVAAFPISVYSEGITARRT